MAGAKKDNQDSAKSDASTDAATMKVKTPVPVSLAARRRRIEKLRERQELMALLDDFGDGDFDLELLDEDDEEEARYVTSEEATDEAEEVIDGDELDDDDEFIDDDFEDED